MQCEKIDDLIESSRIHHTHFQHEFIMVMFTIFQAHSLALKACRREHLESLTLVMTDCWTATAQRICPLLMTEDEYDQAKHHLMRIVEAYQQYLER